MTLTQMNSAKRVMNPVSFGMLTIANPSKGNAVNHTSLFLHLNGAATMNQVTGNVKYKVIFIRV